MEPAIILEITEIPLLPETILILREAVAVVLIQLQEQEVEDIQEVVAVVDLVAEAEADVQVEEVNLLFCYLVLD